MESKDIVIGDSGAAKEWIEAAALPHASKEALSRFVHRFADLTFYKETSARLDEVETIEQITLPRWLRETRQTLASVMPDHYVWMRFDHCLSRRLNVHLTDNWYMLDLYGYYNAAERTLLERVDGLHPFRIGEDQIAGASTLAINLADQTDEHVYQFVLEDLEGGVRQGYLLNKDSFNPMFASYADMFGHIVAIKMVPQKTPETVIEARE